ncbi:DUF2867 domain-containing protein [Nocardia sp. NPDC050435]|uniref:DUF2867 domain-containing protein n=1 Tax=Nocardia sp. NPDC050435 TaxID=3155040 RepID=UPI0033D321D1
MKLPDTAHTTRPWRIHEIAPDFVLYDVWGLPTPGGPDDLPLLVQWFAGSDEGATRPPLVYRFLMAARWRIGAVLRWDTAESGVGTRTPSLRDRLPADLAAGPRGPDPQTVPFTSLYQTHDEWVAEMGNRTVHGLLHLGWVPDGHGGYRGQMAVLVKPNGWFGRLYMAAITAFRYVLVYPALLGMIERGWRQQLAGR